MIASEARACVQVSKPKGTILSSRIIGRTDSGRAMKAWYYLRAGDRSLDYTPAEWISWEEFKARYPNRPPRKCYKDLHELPCVCCGQLPGDVNNPIECGHIHAYAKHATYDGDINERDNMRPECRRCNHLQCGACKEQH